MTSLAKAQVRVPCSTSNLGSGFDTLGLALDHYLTASFEPGGDEFTVERSGTLQGLRDLRPEQDHLVGTFVRTISELRGGAPHGVIRASSDIPVARGLGSSAAALVAGHDLARGALGLASDPRASFLYGRGVEGHGDNAAPCALGGLRAVVPSARGPRALSMELSRDVGFSYAAPAAGLHTAAARAALPKDVVHSVAVAELGRLAALLRGLALADGELIRVGVEDELHVPHRLPLIPNAVNAIGAGYDAGAWAVTISGGGSGLIAMSDPDDAAAVSDAMRHVFAAGADDPDCVGFALRPDFDGLARSW